ncbi:MAG: hypothetical protein DMF73_02095 [Acidobacteria bacterium]|nr:MAG: hypothetical protein DMF73_02095 [Acidobacteriota bacterium]
MENRTRHYVKKLKFAPISILAALLFAAACSLVHKRVETEKLLTPLATANTSDLISTVNKLVGVRSIHGRVDIQFEDTSFAASGIAEKYRTVDGSITLQRPGKVYLIIQAPVVASDIVQMTSDGEHFRIAILQGNEKYRRFVKGTNAANYGKLDMDGASNPAVMKGKEKSEATTVNTLSNLRPQHLTDALLLNPINTEAAGTFYAQSEFFESEKDPSKLESSKRVVRGYYFLDELVTASDKSAHLARRFWFDRVGGIRLARLQSFDEKGVLANDVTYGAVTKFGAEGNVFLPGKISLTRPHDQYKITISYQTPESLTLDHEYPADAFVLPNKWNLPEVDLDEKKTPQPKN